MRFVAVIGPRLTPSTTSVDGPTKIAGKSEVGMRVRIRGPPNKFLRGVV